MQRVEIFKGDECDHKLFVMNAVSGEVCLGCQTTRADLMTRELKRLSLQIFEMKDEIALLKQRSHTHKFTTLPICGECNEVQSLCGCRRQFPPANY